MPAKGPGVGSKSKEATTAPSSLQQGTKGDHAVLWVLLCPVLSVPGHNELSLTRVEKCQFNISDRWTAFCPWLVTQSSSWELRSEQRPWQHDPYSIVLPIMLWRCSQAKIVHYISESFQKLYGFIMHALWYEPKSHWNLETVWCWHFCNSISPHLPLWIDG